MIVKDSSVVNNDELNKIKVQISEAVLQNFNYKSDMGGCKYVTLAIKTCLILQYDNNKLKFCNYKNNLENQLLVLFIFIEKDTTN